MSTEPRPPATRAAPAGPPAQGFVSRLANRFAPRPGFFGVWLPIAVVVLGLPAWLLAFALGIGWREQDQALEARIGKRLQAAANVIDCVRSTQELLSYMLRAFARQSFDRSSGGATTPRGQQRILLRLRWLRHQFPGVLRFRVFDDRFRQVASLTDLPPLDHDLIRRFFQAIDRHHAGDSTTVRQEWRSFRPLLGPALKLRAELYDWVSAASFRRGGRFTFIARPRAGGSFIARIDESPGFSSLGMDFLARRYNRRGGMVKAAVVDRNRSWRTDPALEPDLAAQLTEVATEFERRNQVVLRVGNRQWLRRWLSTDAVLLLVYEEPAPQMIARARQRTGLVLLTAVLPFAGGLTLIWALATGLWVPYLSLRVKLVVVFGCTVALPLAVLGVNGRLYLSERRAGAEAVAVEELTAALQHFDRQLPDTIGAVHRFLARALPRTVPGGYQVAAARRRIEEVAAVVQPSTAELIDERGRLVGPGMTKKASHQRIHKSLQPVYELLIRELNDDPSARDEAMTGHLSAMAAAAGFDIEAGLAEFSRMIGRVAEVQYGEKRNIQAMYPLADARGHIRFLVALAWGRGSLERRHVIRCLTRTARQLTDTEFYAEHERHPRENHPPRFRHHPPLRALSSQVRRNRQVTHDRFRTADGDYLAVAVPGNEISEYFLFGVRSTRQIQAELDAIRWVLGFGSLALLLVSLITGHFLARQFLDPIGNLAIGIDALQRRRFNARIPVVGRDELGAVSEAFNVMIESMADLEVARIVQESLFPNRSLIRGRLSAFGRCLPATQAGGDYFDYFPLPDGRMLLLIGDVSGHGVASAMVMAMAKAVISEVTTTEPRPSAARLLAALDRVLLVALRRLRMMSCFLALIDPDTGTVQFCNAGHNDPCLLRDGRIRSLVQRGYPLGTRARAKWQEQADQLRPGDRLLLYTDGLIEATTRSGGPVGYDRLQEALPGCIGGNPQDSATRLLEWHRTLVVSGPQEDDITVVIAHFD